MDIANILTRKYSGSEWTLDGDDYTGLTWLSDTPKPSKKTLEGCGRKLRLRLLGNAKRNWMLRLLLLLSWRHSV